MLKSGALDFSSLVEGTQANPGHLRVAFNLLESLGWLNCENGERYSLAGSHALNTSIPAEILTLYRCTFDELFDSKAASRILAKWAAVSCSRWEIDDEEFIQYLDGALLFPLFIYLQQAKLLSHINGHLKFDPTLSRPIKNCLLRILEHHGWATRQSRHIYLSDSGDSFLSHIFANAKVLSYREMLYNIDDVIFADCENVIDKWHGVYENSPDHILNMVCKGHQSFFCDLENLIVDVFNRQPLSAQPRYITHIGVGDSALLKSLYDIIVKKTARGAVLEQYPLGLIAVDLQQKALDEVKKTLHGLEHILIKGDPCDPIALLHSLAEQGVKTESILPLRIFVDHKRTFVVAADEQSNMMDVAAKKRASIVVNRQGEEVSGRDQLRSLLKYVQAWGGIVAQHGLIVLEEHSLNVSTVRDNRERCENLHFDACCAFVTQTLICAADFLLVFAAAGLFPQLRFFQCYPKTLPFTSITLNYFEKKPHLIRCATTNDLSSLMILEQLCWPESFRFSEQAIAKRILKYPRGQLVLESGGEVVAVIYSQRIQNIVQLEGINLFDIDKLHKDEGNIIELISLNVSPFSHGKNYGDQLLEFMLQFSALQEGVIEVVAITLCKDFKNSSASSMSEYLRNRDRYGRHNDAILKIHESHGAEISGLIQGYRPMDSDNDGNGVLVKYNLLDRAKRVERYRNVKNSSKYSTEKLPENAIQRRVEYAQVLEYLFWLVSTITGKPFERIGTDLPLMDLGIDSAYLLQLVDNLHDKFSLDVQPTLFFEFNTLDKIAAYITKHAVEKFLPASQLLHDVKVTTVYPEREADQPDSVMDKACAIVGMRFRLPQDIQSAEALWELICAGGSAVSTLPQERWHWPEEVDPASSHKGIDRGGFLSDIAGFDAAFFDIAPSKAELMDPQQRILMELCWQCMEDACYSKEAMAGTQTGVFIGASGSDYKALLEETLSETSAYFDIATSMSVLANRLSYYYDFTGPSIQIDTACSSSLVALHYAMEALNRGECQHALVGGVNIMCHPAKTIAYYKAGMLSIDGQCKTFDHNANGYVRSEGAIMLMLMPLAEAEKTGHDIYAVLRSSTVNHGGRANGLTSPNPVQQKNLIVNAFAKADLDASAIQLFEAHGTGTPLGDPIEVKAIQDACHSLSDAGRIDYSWGLGSIKTNLGHLEAAAGLASLVKAALALRHKTLPRSRNFEKLNTNITFNNGHHYVLEGNKPWPVPLSGEARRAAVSNFGSGGTNAHVLVEEYLACRPVSIAQPNFAYIFPFSAKTQTALRAVLKHYCALLDQQICAAYSSELTLAELSVALIFGRTHLPIRFACVASNKQELLGYLQQSLLVENVSVENETAPLQKSALDAKPLNLLPDQHETYAKQLKLLAKLYQTGADCNWQQLISLPKNWRRHLPVYPFEHQSYWALDQAWEEQWSVETNDFNGIAEIESTDHIAIADALMLSLKSLIARILKYHPTQIETHKYFISMGFDSISLASFCESINKRFALRLTPDVFFNKPSLETFVPHMLERFGESLKDKLTLTPALSAHRQHATTRKNQQNKPLVLNQLRKARSRALLVDTDIAIIGMSGRFPSANNIDEMWQVLSEGRDTVKELPADRFDWHAIYGEGPAKSISKWCATLSGIDEFDAAFFEISPSEAATMDPRQRLLLQEAWNALEDAAYGPQQLASNVMGMFVGLEQGEYQQLAANQDGGIILNHEAILASRLAYFLNFDGPAMALNTACSSGLVAAHQACQSLQSGECDTAIAAAVNLMLSPDLLIGMSQANMLSPMGRCFTFDERANGMVLGEAVVALVLKRYKHAMADGDPIHAVIRGSGINYDGKTNGITAPNGDSQARLFQSIYQKYGIDPKDISYIVTHGTATKLGDPVEINALNRVFSILSKEKNSCALTSTKSNFGHTLGASGLLSLVSLARAIGAATIPASLHCEQENAYIDWQNSPFYVNKKTRTWGLEKGRVRMGAVSAFGMSGTNAHMVVAQHQDSFTHAANPARVRFKRSYFLLAISAKTAEALNQRIGQLLIYLRQRSWQEGELQSLSYTSLVGRHHFDYRCALVISDVDQAVGLLQQVHCQSVIPEPGLYMSSQIEGSARSGAKALQAMGELMLQQAFARRHATSEFQHALYALADLFCQGYDLQWAQLFASEQPIRLHMPGYPFAKRRFAIPPSDLSRFSRNPPANTSPSTYWLHRNESNFYRQQYSSEFGGAYFSDYDSDFCSLVIQLSMLHAALVDASGCNQLVLQSARFSRTIVPVPGTGSITVKLVLTPTSAERILFRIFSESEGDLEPCVYGEGLALISNVSSKSNIFSADTQAKLDIDRFKARASSLSPCKEQYPAMQMLYVLRDGPNKTALAKLSCVQKKTSFDLPFSAEIVSVLGLIGACLHNENNALPDPTYRWCAKDIRVKHAQIVAALTENLWLQVELLEGKSVVESMQLSIRIYADDGCLLTVISQLQIQLEKKSVQQKTSTLAQAGDEYAIHRLQETWQKQALQPDKLPASPKLLLCFLNSDTYQRRLLNEFTALNSLYRVVFVSTAISVDTEVQDVYMLNDCNTECLQQCLQTVTAKYGKIDALAYLWGAEDQVYLPRFTIIANLIKALVNSATRPHCLILASEYGDEALQQSLAESWIGFERSLGIILPGTAIKVILREHSDKNTAGPFTGWAERLLMEISAIGSQSVLYRHAERYTKVLSPIPDYPADGPCALKQGGTYLITGGLGELGILLASHLATRYNAKLILIGRSKLDEHKRNQLELLCSQSDSVEYVSMDVCDVKALEVVFERAVEGIDGVIHAAGIESQFSVIDASESEFNAVIQPKVDGTQVLTHCAEKYQVDFICYFSSTSALLGDFGACSYAIANRFLMAYGDACQASEKHVKTVTLCWPLWACGGMGLSENNNALPFMQQSGQRGLQAEEGIALFEELLAANCSQAVIFSCRRTFVENLMNVDAVVERRVNPATLVSIDKTVEAENDNPVQRRHSTAFVACSAQQNSLLSKVLHTLKTLVAKLLQYDIAELHSDTYFLSIGFDSITLANLCEQINRCFRLSITPDVFFNYSNLLSLSAHFLKQYEATLTAYYTEIKPSDLNSSEDVRGQKYSSTMANPSLQNKHHWQQNLARQTSRFQGVRQEIAIIGMSGRFPSARNIDEMWQILLDGRDVVREIPAERFDWRPYYISEGSDSCEGKITSKWCATLDGVDEFDAEFFEISPREAMSLDPRQRLLLQESWNAMEDAGLGPRHIAEQIIGMFVGVEAGEYQQLTENKKSGIIVNHDAILASRLAYFLNLDGPVMAINTACSSGLVAAHQACQSLQTGECDAAIVASANLMLTPELYMAMSHANMLSPAGRCFTFDERANGLVPGEAVVALVLKRKQDALDGGDPIHALIRGSGINYDGKTNGITAPSGLAQSRLLRGIYQNYGIETQDISYIVTHGTGTKLGDPVEINALNAVFAEQGCKSKSCALSSTKSNFGHTFAASGLLSLISLVQAMRAKVIPASLHCERESTYINWDESPFYVNKQVRPWRLTHGQPRLGAVSAFGMSGTNAHMVLSDYEQSTSPVESEPGYGLLVLSAKTPLALTARITQLLRYLQSGKSDNSCLSSLSLTLLEGRHHFTYRCAVVAETRAEAIVALQRLGELNNFERGLSGQTCFVGKSPTNSDALMPLQKMGEGLLEQALMQKSSSVDYQHTLFALADLFCQGYALAWHKLFQFAPLVRQHLPTYPFTRECYWYSTLTQSQQTQQASVKALVVEGVEDAHAVTPIIQKDIARKGISLPDKQYVVSALQATTVGIGSATKIQLRQIKSLSEPREFSGIERDLTLQTEPQKLPIKTMQVSASKLMPDLKISLAKVLYLDIDALDENKSFVALGLDSVIGVEWIHELNKQFKLKLSASCIYDYPDLKALAKQIAAAVNDKINNETVSEVDKKAGSETNTIINQSTAVHVEHIQNSASMTEAHLTLAQHTPVQPIVERPIINKRDLLTELRDSLSQALYLDAKKIQDQRNFVELGLDSIIGVEWLRTLNQRYGCGLSMANIYDHPTLMSLTEFLLNKKLASMLVNGQVEKAYSADPVDAMLDEIILDVTNHNLDTQSASKLLSALQLT